MVLRILKKLLEKMYEKFVSLIETHAPSQTIVNDMDEIEKLFAEAL